MIASKLTPGLCVAAAALLLSAASTHAQTPGPSTNKFFASVNIGGQLASRNLDTQISKTVYDETATLTASTPIGTGVMPDFGVGYRVYGDIFVGVTISLFSTTSTASTSTVVPDPLLFDRSVRVAGSVADLKHKETAILPQMIWTTAVTDKVDFVAGAGPAFIRVSQDVVNGFAVPAGTQNVNATAGNETASAVGFAASIGVNYNLTPRFAVGGLARFAPGKVTLASGAKDLNVGGMQVGGGIRVNF